VAATKALAAEAPILKDPQAGLLPDVVDVREISVIIAKAVIKEAVKEGLAQVEDIPEDDQVLQDWIREQMWEAEYRKLRKVDSVHASSHAKGQAGSGRTQ
jgi:malate dehydrogenase (oxaloacetate-decarboxylating)